jgi:uncharacterized repeat protein (TIGR01451 family)
MGTKTNSRRSHRASRRGLASFVSFLLLFAFALGQSGSLIAFASDSGTAPAATDDAGSDGSVSRLSTLPVAQAPAAEASGTDASSGDSAASSSGGAATTSRTTSSTRSLHITRANRPAALAAPAAPPAGGLAGGDIGLDFVAAGPFTYNHTTGLGSPPQFGYDNRTISKTNGVVESLEGGDFECGDLVTFFVQVKVEADAAGSGSVALDMSFGNETTGQPGIGFDNIVSVAINTPDGGNVALDGNETASLSNEHLDTSGYDEIKGTVTVTNLDPGETAIVRIIVHLACEVGASPTGNILNAIDAANIVGGDKVSVGQETVPMKQVGEVAQPGMNVNKSCPAFALVGDTISYSISIENTGNEALNLTSVVDTVDGHAGVNITASFPASVAAGATVTRTYQYTVVAGDPSPLPNSVAVAAQGAISHATINGSASCENPILHPEITITKTCPQTAPVGDDITYEITIENTGDEMLDTIVVTDTVNGNSPVDISNLFVDSLAPGASDTQEYVYNADGTEPDPLPNSATVTANGATSDKAVNATDSCSTDITHVPAIDVTKSCPQTAPFGEDVTFTITVKNVGNEPLTNVSVTDALLGGDITAAFSIPNPMPVGVVYSHQFTYSPGANEDPVKNSVTAVGYGADSKVKAEDTASCETDVTHAPALEVTKSCPETVPFGEDITYTITVTNTGNEALTGVTVDDTLLGDITGEFDFDFSNPFPVDEVATATVIYSPGADEDPVSNTVTATGYGEDSQAKAEGTASCRTDVTHAPGLEVTKECPQTVPFGEDITYTITVTNTGNEALEGVTVNDTLLGDITDQFDVDFSGSFGVGAVATATVTYSPGVDADPVNNTVTVTGMGADSEAQASATASCSTDVLHPAIQIVKDGPSLVHVGDTITYTFEVTNPGELELFDVVLSDPICDAGTILPGADVDSSLAVGEVWHYSCTHLVTDTDPDPLPNTATINGDTTEGEGGQPVSDTDDHVVDIIHPGISIVKTVDEEIVPIGTTVTFTYVITNTGDTTLYNVSVDDDILGHVGDIEVLEAGASVTLTKDFVVGDEIVTNVGTAAGEDVLGRSVSANDTATVAPIAGENPPPPSTPFTGSDAGRLGIITVVLFGIGVTVVASTRRRRAKGEAA